MRTTGLASFLFFLASCASPQEPIPASQPSSCSAWLPARTSSGEWPLACASGSAPACLALELAKNTWSGDRELARTFLRKSCVLGGCGCLAYGTALLEDWTTDSAHDGIEALEEACGSGITEACLRIRRETDRCRTMTVVERKDSLICDEVGPKRPETVLDAE